MATASQLLDFYAPQFKEDDDKATAISVARRRTSDSAYGDKKEDAVALMAAHLLAMRDRGVSTGGAGGQVASNKEGQLSQAFFKDDAAGTGDQTLSQTTYGSQLVSLRKGTILPMGASGGIDVGP